MLTEFDYILLAIILVISCVSMIKGFLGELVSLLSVLVASLFSYSFGSYFSTWLFDIISIKLVVFTLAYGFSFLLSLVIIYKILSKFVGIISLSKSLDLILGFAFGFLKSILVIGGLLFIIEFLVPADVQPDIVRYSYLKALFLNIKN